MDLLALGSLLEGAAKIADPYILTDQEKAQLANQNAATAATVTVSNNALAAEQSKQHTQEQIVKYGLLGVLGVGSLFLASQLIRGQ